MRCLVPIFCETKFCGVLWTRNGGGARLLDSSENCPLSFWGFLIELEIKDDRACGTYGLEQCYRVLVGKYEGKKRLGRRRCRWVIILKWIVKKWNGRALTGLICLRIGTGGRLLWTRWWTFSFHKMWRVCWPSEDLLASEGLCLMELVSWCFERPSSALQRRTSRNNFMDCVGTFECACTVDQVLLPLIMCQLWCVLGRLIVCYLEI